MLVLNEDLSFMSTHRVCCYGEIQCNCEYFLVENSVVSGAMWKLVCVFFVLHML